MNANNVTNPTANRGISRAPRASQNRSTRRSAARRVGTANRTANRRQHNVNRNVGMNRVSNYNIADNNAFDMYGIDGNLAYDTAYNGISQAIPVSTIDDTSNDYAFFKRSKTNDETPDTPNPTSSPEGNTNPVNPTQPTPPASPVPTGLNDDDVSTTQDDNIQDLNDTNTSYDTNNNNDNPVRTRSTAPAKRAMK